MSVAASMKGNMLAAAPFSTEPVIHKAKYVDQLLSEYQGNPLIEALPQILTLKDAVAKLSHYPKAPPHERSLPPELRRHCVNRLKKLVYPLPEAFEFEPCFSELIRQGYLAHNPHNPATWRHRYSLAMNSESGVPTGHISTTASCLMVSGYSGIGKSTMVESILRLYPQVIHHESHNVKKLNLTQIVFLKINIPYDGLLSPVAWP